MVREVCAGAAAFLDVKARRLGRVLRCCRGFTLVEVLVAAVLLSLILGVAYFFAGSVNLQWKKGDFENEVQQNLQLAMDRLTREIRYSRGTEVIAPGELILKAPENMDYRYVKYYLYGQELKRTTSQDKVGWWGHNPVATHISAVNFAPVSGFPATLEVTLVGTNGYTLTSRVTVRVLRG